MAASLSAGGENTVVGQEAPSAPATAAKAPPPADWSWKFVLERCRKVASAHSIIAIDLDGLPVAWTGLTDQLEASRIAAHVGKAFDLLDRLKYVGRFAECLCTMYWPEGTWLTAVRIAPNVSTVVTVAVVGPHTMVDRGRRLLRNTFLRLLEDAWPA